MIRYLITRAQLITRIRAAKPGWLEDAAVRTGRFKKARRYSERRGNWSAIKAVYLALQNEKCAYCERRLAAGEFGGIEHDVEHYRPKGSVKAWPTKAQAKARGLDFGFKLGAAMAVGYFMQAYEILNYATACKTCNSSLKSNAFPIAGPRARPTPELKKLRREKPFLVYPVGNVDADPQRVISFRGLLPVPVAKTGVRHRRAVVTIEFFELDTREELLRERADVIANLRIALDAQTAGSTNEIRQSATQAVARAQRPSSRHSSCASAFVALSQTDSAAAVDLATAAQQYLDSQSP